MTFQVSRNGQTYGPYTLDDLQRYLASGNVLGTDLAKSDDMPDWLPVSQILAGQMTAAAAQPFQSYNDAAAAGTPGGPVAPYGAGPYAAQPYNPSGGAAYDNPPNLQWGLVLLFAVLTCGLFMLVWNLIVTVWLRKVQPSSNALFFYIGSYVLSVLQIFSFVPMMHAISAGITPHTSPLLSLVGLVAWVLKLVARFVERSDLQTHYNTVEPMGLDINPVMVFFFGGLYLQSVLNKVNLIKTGAYAAQSRNY